MPWEIVKRDDEFCVVQQNTNETVKCHPTRSAAEAHMRALYANELSTESGLGITFVDDEEVAASFTADAERRTIAGIVVPWRKVARSGMSRWRFERGSLRWAETSRVKLNLNHDRKNAIGKAIRLHNTEDGLEATFKVARGTDGDKALALAEDGVLDGFSIEVDFDDGDEWRSDPSDKQVRLVKRGRLAGVALTGFPAFDDARADRIAAARVEGEQMADQENQEKEVRAEQDPAAESFHQALEDWGKAIVGSQERLMTSVGDSVSAGIKTVLEEMAAPQAQPGEVRAARYGTLREPPVYRLDGTGENSICRDAWKAVTEKGTAGGDAALDRIRKFRMQQDEAVTLMSNAAAAQFAPITTSVGSAVIPPGYRPDLYVGELQRLRPLVSLASRGSLDNATPFTVPTFTSSTSVTADHVEGTNPSDGSLALGPRTVIPGAVSGRLVLTREMVDSSNPAIDQIAVATMRESYARQTEAKAYTLLNGTDGAGGTITSGFVPSGAQASTTAKGTDNQTLVKHLRQRLIDYPFARFDEPTGAALNQAAAGFLGTAVDTTQRPLFPSVGAQNAFGLANAGGGRGWDVDGLVFRSAWAMTGVAAGDSQILIVNRQDWWVWESPLLTFRYEEKQGPANIELNVFGYFGTHLLRPVGLMGIRIT